MHPMAVSKENKQMVQENIKYVLHNHLKNSRNGMPFVEIVSIKYMVNRYYERGCSWI